LDDSKVAVILEDISSKFNILSDDLNGLNEKVDKGFAG